MSVQNSGRKPKLKRKRIGINGEDSAVALLKQKDYKIIARNYSSENGEIDVVALKQGVLVFVEVKTNSDLRFGRADFRVNSKKRYCMKRTIYDFLKRETRSGKVPYYRFGIRLEKSFDSVRCDAVEVYVSNENRITEIDHKESIFEFSDF